MRRRLYSQHALRRMFERGITEEDVAKVLEQGEIIADYPQDSPFPSRLVLGFAGTIPLHVVLASSNEEDIDIVVTVYSPSLERWQPDYKTRKPS